MRSVALLSSVLLRGVVAFASSAGASTGVDVGGRRRAARATRRDRRRTDPHGGLEQPALPGRRGDRAGRARGGRRPRRSRERRVVRGARGEHRAARRPAERRRGVPRHVGRPDLRPRGRHRASRDDGARRGHRAHRRQGRRRVGGPARDGGRRRARRDDAHPRAVTVRRPHPSPPGRTAGRRRRSGSRRRARISASPCSRSPTRPATTSW